MKEFDFIKHECEKCQTLMNYEYFNKYHTEKECNFNLGLLIAREQINFNIKKGGGNVNSAR